MRNRVISKKPYSMESTMHTWQSTLAQEKQKPYFQKKLIILINNVCWAKPSTEKQHTFNALSTTPLAKVKVVILGQDPYHGPGQAMAYAFQYLNQHHRPRSKISLKN